MLPARYPRRHARNQACGRRHARASDAAVRNSPLLPRISCLSSSSTPLGGRLYVCRIRKAAEAYSDAIPSIDNVDEQCELDLLFLCEMSLQGFVGALLRVAFGESRQGLGPAERGTFPIGIAGSFAPGGSQIDALLAR